MALADFEALFAAADRRPAPARVAIAGAADGTVLVALAEAARRGWVEPILVAEEDALRATAAAHRIDISGFRIVSAGEPAAAAVDEVRAGRASFLMKGQIPTPDLMRAVLRSDSGLRTERTICQVVLMEMRSGEMRSGRRFLLADTGICIQPTLEQKADMLRSLAQVARNLGVAAPSMALLAATEKATPAMPDTLDSAELQRRGEAGEFPGCTVQGPLSFDLAYAAEAGAKKQIGGAVIGAADVMLFPNLVAANLTVKAMMYTADCRFGGLLCGAACPVIFMSRADTAETRLNSLAFALAAFPQN
jgi:phosphotransacetylase